MINAYFDAKAFIQAVDQVREARGITSYYLWRETGVETGSLRRMRQGKADCNIHTLATLAIWANIDVQQFMKKQEIPA